MNLSDARAQIATAEQTRNAGDSGNIYDALRDLEELATSLANELERAERHLVAVGALELIHRRTLLKISDAFLGNDPGTIERVAASIHGVLQFKPSTAAEDVAEQIDKAERRAARAERDRDAALAELAAIRPVLEALAKCDCGRIATWRGCHDCDYRYRCDKCRGRCAVPLAHAEAVEAYEAARDRPEEKSSRG